MRFWAWVIRQSLFQLLLWATGCFSLCLSATIAIYLLAAAQTGFSPSPPDSWENGIARVLGHGGAGLLLLIMTHLHHEDLTQELTDRLAKRDH